MRVLFVARTSRARERERESDIRELALDKESEEIAEQTAMNVHLDVASSVACIAAL